MNFKSKKILVLGDVILDIYSHGKSTKLSPEAPVIVSLIHKEEYLLGGCGNVCANLREFECEVDICSVISDDFYGQYILHLLKKRGIGTDLLTIQKGFQTTTKNRVISNDQHVVRYDREETFSNEHIIIDALNRISKKYECVIISDYAKGVISDSVMVYVKDNLFDSIVLVDPKPENKHLYQGVFCITPNIHELYSMSDKVFKPARYNEDEVLKIGKDIKKEIDVANVVITMSDRGFMSIDIDGKAKKVEAHHYENKKERHHKMDVTGAGDTFVSVLSLWLSLGELFEDSCRIANMAAGVVVQKLGTQTCTWHELKSEMEKIK